MTQTHTPGPFFRSGNWIMASRVMHSVHVAEIKADNEADIDLFAASADMLKALRECVDLLCDVHADEAEQTENARAAIAKATGAGAGAA